MFCFQTMKSISREELKRAIEHGGVVVVDVLSPEQFQKSHIPGALNLPSDRVAELAPKLLPDRHAHIVTYCMNFTWRLSDQVARELIDMGYANVWNYQEGKQDWVKAALPLEGDAPDEPIAGFLPSDTEIEARKKLRAAS
jgi:rhodanese-related sulfurtransferase